MITFYQSLIDGLGSGGVYALLALALVLLYRSSGLVNFAQGEMAMFSAYVYLALTRAGLQTTLAVVAAFLISFGAGLLVERLLLRRLAGNAFALMLMTLALFVGIDALVGFIWSNQPTKLPRLFGSDMLRFAGVGISVETQGTLATLAGLAAVLYLLNRYTRLGLAMRAAASNPEAAALLGLRGGLLLGIGFGLAAALGCLAGVIASTRLSLDPSVMQVVLVFAIAAATVGGLDSPLGAILAGLLLGIVESLAATYLLSPGLRIIVPLVLIIGFLSLRPTGLFGSPRWGRV